MNTILSKLKKLALFDRIVIALGIVGVVFFAYIFFRKASYLTVVVKVGEDDIQLDSMGTRAWFSQLFYAGMQEKDGLGITRAEVLRVHSYNVSPNRKALYLTIKIRSVYNRSSGQYAFKGFPVLVGSTMRLYLNKLLVDGLVTNVEGIIDPRTKKSLIVETQILDESPVFPETYGVKEHIANALHVNDKVNDSLGNTIVTIVDKKVENAKKVVSTSNGQLVLQRDPLKKDVYLTLQIEATVINDKYFMFDDVPILVGQTIPLNLPSVSVWPEVTKIIVQ